MTMKMQELLIKPIGNNLKAKRLENNMTQRELAKAIGVSHSVIQRYECGAIAIPFKNLIALSEVLNVHPGYLMGFSEDSNKPTFTNIELAEKRYNESEEYKNLIDLSLTIPDESLGTIVKMLSVFKQE